MNKIEHIITGLYLISNNLDKLANQDKNWPIDTQVLFENMAWEAYRMANALKEFKEALGV